MYPLPVTAKANYVKWAGTLLQKGTFEGYSVLWAGTAVSKRVGLHNVHILQKGDDYVYATRRGDAFQALGNKYTQKFFSKYALAHVPPHNRCIQPVHGNLIEVPFVPTATFEALQTAPAPKRKRQRTAVDFDIPYPTWRNTPPRPTVKHQITGSFGKLFEDADTRDEFHIPDPFAEFHSLDTLMASDEGKTRYNIVAGFIYHYCRDNLGYPRAQ
tara:strand:+ start:116 stop:757 length:642 start_codon:yes stop_codon:yes gene_type:complete